MDSLLQTHDRFVLHLPHRTFEYPLPCSFCTFDYHVLCRRLQAQSGAEILHASVLGHCGHAVYTTRGTFDAEILIDATGWRAALATNSQQRALHNEGKSFGLETAIPVSEDGLHFYYDPQRLHAQTVGWLFPVGDRSRLGLGSYLGRTQLNETLPGFARADFGCSADGLHGGYFPYRRQPATTDHVFRIGHTAGQCIPLTGEGIRRALYFGAMIGRLTRRVLEGELRELNALREYRQFIKRHAEPYRYLLPVQKGLPGLPIRCIEYIASLVQRPGVLGSLLHWYWNVFDPHALASFWPAHSTSIGFSSRLPVQSELAQPGRSVP